MFASQLNTSNSFQPANLFEIGYPNTDDYDFDSNLNSNEPNDRDVSQPIDNLMEVDPNENPANEESEPDDATALQMQSRFEQDLGDFISELDQNGTTLGCEFLETLGNCVNPPPQTHTQMIHRNDSFIYIRFYNSKILF